MLNILLLIIGIALLSIGGELLIRGSLGAAKFLGISPLLSGLVIVGFGTSTPELVVSISAAINEQPDIAVGNVVGSNIGNVLLILGICAVIRPLTIKPIALRRDATIVVLSSFLFTLLIVGAIVGRLDALILLVALLSYLGWAYQSERHSNMPSAELHKTEAEEVHNIPHSILWTLFAVFIGLFLLIAGSQVLLSGAIGIAESFHVSEAVIGLTLVAVGTSLPELSISVIATIRRHADVAVGNILGSNIFNVLGILGISALLQPLSVHSRILDFDQWVMLTASILLLMLLYTSRNINRLEGAFLLICYGLYLVISFTFFG
ncbi:MAG: calcium/sodium antiporter [Balneolales bacterium]